MLIAFAAAIVNLAAAPAGQATDSPTVRMVSPVCQNLGPHMADEAKDHAPALLRPSSDQPPVHPLTQEPPADAVATVLYSEGNCSKPIVISRGIGTETRHK